MPNNTLRSNSPIKLSGPVRIGSKSIFIMVTPTTEQEKIAERLEPQKVIQRRGFKSKKAALDYASFLGLCFSYFHKRNRCDGSEFPHHPQYCSTSGRTAMKVYATCF
jgi:hypothetical protein